ncbi:hypothetical protein XENTR_v10007901 [Xenopus tropicalis]|nr:hypothetical protein XENTR_v10007901 [Xenopus tropicalis]
MATVMSHSHSWLTTLCAVPKMAAVMSPAVVTPTHFGALFQGFCRLLAQGGGTHQSLSTASPSQTWAYTCGPGSVWRPSLQSNWPRASPALFGAKYPSWTRIRGPKI